MISAFTVSGRVVWVAALVGWSVVCHQASGSLLDGYGLEDDCSESGFNASERDSSTRAMREEAAAERTLREMFDGLIMYRGENAAPIKRSLRSARQILRQMNKKSGHEEICGINGYEIYPDYYFPTRPPKVTDTEWSCGPRIKECPRFPFEKNNTWQDRLIINGNDALVNDFPWVASVKVYDRALFFLGKQCTGTILSRMLILTSAECVLDCKSRGGRKLLYEPSQITAYIGKPVMGPLTFLFAKADVYFQAILVPRTRTCTSLVDDYAILIAKEPMKFHETLEHLVMPICLSNKIHTKEDEEKFRPAYYRGLMAGFGETSKGDGGRSNWLQYTDVKILRQEGAQICRQFPNLTYAERQRVFCGFSARGGAGCDGDSGAPLMINEHRDGRKDFNDLFFELYGLYSNAYIGKECHKDNLMMYHKVNTAQVIRLARMDDPVNPLDPFDLTSRVTEWQEET